MTSSNLLKGIVTGIAGTLFATAALASDAHVAPMTDFAKSTVKQWTSNPTVIEAIKAQNAKHAGLSQTDIDSMDKDWRAQTDAGSKPMIDAVLGNALSAYLRGKQEAAGLLPALLGGRPAAASSVRVETGVPEDAIAVARIMG